MENKKYSFDNEYDKDTKRRWQERIKKGLPVNLYILNDADKEDLECYRAYLEVYIPVKEGILHSCLLIGTEQ